MMPPTGAAPSTTATRVKPADQPAQATADEAAGHPANDTAARPVRQPSGWSQPGGAKGRRVSLAAHAADSQARHRNQCDGDSREDAQPEPYSEALT